MCVKRCMKYFQCGWFLLLYDSWTMIESNPLPLSVARLAFKWPYRRWQFISLCYQCTDVDSSSTFAISVQTLTVHQPLPSVKRAAALCVGLCFQTTAATCWISWNSCVPTGRSWPSVTSTWPWTRWTEPWPCRTRWMTLPPWTPQSLCSATWSAPTPRCCKKPTGWAGRPAGQS